LFDPFEDNPENCLSDLANVLNDLGVLYKNSERIKEAEEVYLKSLRIRYSLA